MGGILAAYSSGCLRYIPLSKGAPPVVIDPIYELLGAHHEDWYATVLGDRLKEREFVVRKELSETVMYSGRVDFIDVDGVIHETKASLSPSFKYDVIRKGKYKISHLAQLVSYMIQLQAVKGVIACGFYKLRKDDSFERVETRLFDVKIDTDGSIIVDGVDTGHTVVSQYQHTLAVKKALETGEIGERPVNSNEFSGPCTWCPLKLSCNKYDKGDINEEQLRAESSDILKNLVPKPFKRK